MVNCSHCHAANATACCARCMDSYYCNSSCRKAHWRIHKPICTAARRNKQTPILQETMEDTTGSIAAPLLALAEQGDAKAQFELGVIYENGVTVTKNTSTAAKWYEKAATQGNEFAQYNLALLLEVGNGVRQDSTAAAEWYKACISQCGSAAPKACFGLALLLRRAAELPTTDTEDMLQKSHQFLMCASEAQDGQAMMQASANFMAGRGVEQDFDLGIDMLVQAASLGREGARQGLRILGLDEEGQPIKEIVDPID